MQKVVLNPVMTWLLDGAIIKIEEKDGSFFASGNDDIYRGCLWAASLDKLYELVKDAINGLAELSSNNTDKKE